MRLTEAARLVSCGVLFRDRGTAKRNRGNSKFLKITNCGIVESQLERSRGQDEPEQQVQKDV
jgi:hypothetical protein